MAVELIDTITDSEWEIMRVIWTQKESTSNDMIDILHEKTQWKPSTVKTLLSRLVDKGYLETRREGKQFVYSALIKEESGMNHAIDHLLEKVCNKDVGKLTYQLINEEELSLSDIEKLQQLLEEKKQTAPDTIICTCIPGQCRCEER